MKLSGGGLKRTYETLRNNHWTPILFFFGGFVFDFITVERIDEPVQIVQIFLYSALLTFVVYYRILEEFGSWVAEGRWAKVWKYQEFLTQFLLGALLNLYSLFYFKSASLGASLVFIALIGALIWANEFVKLERHHVFLILTLYFICMTSLWLAMVPMILGFVGTVPFLLSLVMAGGGTYLLHRAWARRLNPDLHPSLTKKILRTGGGTIAFFLLSYYLQLIPPIPLAVQYMGIFHDLKKENGEYVLSYSRPWWRFWENGDQTFLARPGDKVVCFASVFSPRGFKDQLNVRWLLKTPSGWQKQDLIPITVAGGREEGFRGYTVKSNYQPGTYRVQVETTDGREVGRIGLEIIPDESGEERTFQKIIK